MVRIVSIPKGKITNVPKINTKGITKRLGKPRRPFRNDFNFSILDE